MIRYLLRRIGYGFLILIGVNLLTFMLFFTVNTPDDMARLNIGGKRVAAEAVQVKKTGKKNTVTTNRYSGMRRPKAQTSLRIRFFGSTVRG